MITSAGSSLFSTPTLKLLENHIYDIDIEKCGKELLTFWEEAMPSNKIYNSQSHDSENFPEMDNFYLN